MGDRDVDACRPFAHPFFDLKILRGGHASGNRGDDAERRQLSEDVAVKNGKVASQSDIAQKMARLFPTDAAYIFHKPPAQFVWRRRQALNQSREVGSRGADVAGFGAMKARAPRQMRRYFGRFSVKKEMTLPQTLQRRPALMRIGLRRQKAKRQFGKKLIRFFLLPYGAELRQPLLNLRANPFAVRQRVPP